MNKENDSLCAWLDLATPSFSGIVWSCIGSTEMPDRRGHDEEITRMIELNGLVAFDPEMFDLP